MDRIEVFREALKTRVCGICFDRNDNGTCGLPQGRVCALEGHLPEIVRAVESVHSFDLTPYVEGIRSQVCPNCNQDVNGRCAFRENFDCSVDNFLLLVVDTIEDVKRQQGEEALG